MKNNDVIDNCNVEVLSSADNIRHITSSLYEQIVDIINTEDIDGVELLINNNHPSDVAAVLSQLKTNERKWVFDTVGDVLDGAIIVEFDEYIQKEILDDLRPKIIAKIIGELESDDAVDIIENIDEKKQKSILRYVDSVDRETYKRALSYPEDTAGRISSDSYVGVPSIWTVGHVLDMLNANGDDLPDDFFSVVVLDKNKPIGQINLSRLVREKKSVTLKSLIKDNADNFYTIHATLPKAEISAVFKSYDIIDAPVIDDNGEMVGMISVDDVVDIVEEEVEDDIYKLSGLSESDIFSDIFQTTKLRFTWLLANLFTGVFASVAIAMYSEQIEKIVALAILMPIVASMGGNAGVQTLTVVVRGIATNEITSLNILRILWKESIVGSLNGIILSFIAGAAVYFWFGNIILAFIMMIAMILSMFTAGLSGVLIPIALDKLKIDPAVASTVILTTVTDVVSFLTFLGIASLAF